MRIKNFDEVVSQLQDHLEIYLQEHGRDTSAMFNCINPAHPDHSPSCSTHGSDGKLFHCFGCGCAGDIFKAAHYLEGKPLVGKEFIIENLMYLASKYEIPVDSTEITEEELYELDTYRAYRYAADCIIAGQPTDEFKEAIKERNWNKQICDEYGVGHLATYKDFRENLKKLGFKAEFLDNIDLNRKELFDDGHLIFTIRDEHGRPVGFSSRNLRYTEDKKNGEKYINTAHKCSIYKKSSRLFGFDRLIKKHTKKSDPVYIFEGYADVITACQHGLTNSVAVGGTAFTIDQLQLLKDYGYYNLILCLDGDNPGQQATANLLDSTLGGQKDVKISVVIIPDGMDPDDFIKVKGVPEFKNLLIRSAFEWRLLQFPEDADPETICKSMVPLIVNESSNVVQEQMVKTLSLQTGISQKAIQADVVRLQNSREAEKSRERQNILDKMTRVIQRSPTEAEYYMHEAQSALYELNRRFDEDAFSEDNCLSFLDAQKNYQEAKTGQYMGFVLGPDLRAIQGAFCGEWKKDIWITLGGSANVGKSSLLSKMAYEIADHEENDAVVIYHSIDDSADQLLPKFICVAEGSRMMTINQVQDPNFHAKGVYEKKIRARRETGYEKIRNLMKNGRFVIKDSNDGSTIAYADMLIKYYKDKYPNRNIVYILDNFHKLQDFAGLDERVRFKCLSTQIKALATKHHVCILSTVEYTKLQVGQKPSNTNVAETVQILYDANAIIHLYSDLHEFGERATHFHLAAPSESEEAKRMPRIEVIIGKNKISGFKGRIWLDFYPDCSDWAYVDESIPAEDEKNAKSANNDRNRINSILGGANEY